jgi:peptide/nickel transport system permease protein
LIFFVIVLAALLAPWVAPHNPFDPAHLELLDAFTPPSWTERGTMSYFLGTDDQGRDVISAIIFARACRW